MFQSFTFNDTFETKLKLFLFHCFYFHIVLITMPLFVSINAVTYDKETQNISLKYFIFFHAPVRSNNHSQWWNVSMMDAKVINTFKSIIL